MGRNLWLLLVIFQIAGCATLQGRQNDMERVWFESNVSGAEIHCGGKEVRTPGFLELRQSESHNCYGVKDGYSKKMFRIWTGITREGFLATTRQNWQGWGKWTLGIGNLLAWPVDFLSGAMRELHKKKVFVLLKPVSEVNTREKITGKAMDVGRSIIAVPNDVAEETTQAAVDSAVRGTAEQLGIPDSGKPDHKTKKTGSQNDVR